MTRTSDLRLRKNRFQPNNKRLFKHSPLPDVTPQVPCHSFVSIANDQDAGQTCAPASDCEAKPARYPVDHGNCRQYQIQPVQINFFNFIFTLNIAARFEIVVLLDFARAECEAVFGQPLRG
jgi:hypothetical protein